MREEKRRKRRRERERERRKATFLSGQFSDLAFILMTCQTKISENIHMKISIYKV